MPILNKTGLIYLWSKIKALLNNKSDVGHSHSYTELSNKPTIPTVPSSLPANGGNADTVDGKHLIVSSSVPTTNNTSIVTFVI